MSDNYIRHIPVYRSDEGDLIESLKITGIISSRDVIRALNQLISETPDPPSLGIISYFFFDEIFHLQSHIGRIDGRYLEQICRKCDSSLFDSTRCHGL
jgi:hypothetical protein